MTESVDLDSEIFGPDSTCFGCSPRHPIGFRLRFRQEGELVTTTFLPHDDLAGPPGIMHGGLVTTLADEVAAWTVVAQKARFGFTGAITAKLLRPVRIGVLVEAEGRIVRESSRVLEVEVRLMQHTETVYKGTFTFVLLDEAGAEKLLGGPLPAEWRSLARGSRGAS
jgi:acyl-coenzyme A thioesterase PaaI-like protein